MPRPFLPRFEVDLLGTLQVAILDSDEALDGLFVIGDKRDLQV